MTRSVDLEQISARIHDAMLEPIAIPDSDSVTARVSIGSAMMDGMQAADRLIRAADLSMYEAKRGV